MCAIRSGGSTSWRQANMTRRGLFRGVADADSARCASTDDTVLEGGRHCCSSRFVTWLIPAVRHENASGIATFVALLVLAALSSSTIIFEDPSPLDSNASPADVSFPRVTAANIASVAATEPIAFASISLISSIPTVFLRFARSDCFRSVRRFRFPFLLDSRRAVEYSATPLSRVIRRARSTFWVVRGTIGLCGYFVRFIFMDRRELNR